ncbi:MAG: nickel pincer cofactor biosynthesis protein LarC [Candidatus Rokubacteria bacterium]|nr:nickel pincer cofactor biosynthesis protein LarC [Candidatus Rokubacteria bacterium]
MRVVFFDCPSGASGDMILGALVDAGVPVERLRDELARLHLRGWSLAAREVTKGAFRATKVDVGVDGGHHHARRNLGDILGLLAASTLTPEIVATAGRIFTRLAEAEARVHGSTVDEVHFHDVGAVDAIVDVTGAVIGLAALGAQAVFVSPLPLGGGLVGGPHGRIPVPGPGTLELLRGFAVVDTGVRAELVTPTGAAILTTLASAGARVPPMTVTAIGYGAGTMDLPDTPNIIRCVVGEAAEPGDAPAAAAGEAVTCVETTIDDMSPQLYEPLMERLFEAGALDVFLTPVIMKRSRPGVTLTALAPAERLQAVTRVLFEESTTIGVRWSEWRRARLEREMVTLPTSYGALPFKVSRLDGRVVTVTPEFADVARIARDKSLPAREVLDAARAEGRRLLQR